MIVGVYSESEGARISVDVFLPDLMATVTLPFIVDTGAIVTSISQDDLRTLGQAVTRGIALRPGSPPMSGIGGQVRWWQFDGALTFKHEDGGTTSISQPLAMLTQRGMPSLLGRDILSLGVLTLDGPGHSVSLDLPQGFIR